MDPYQSMMNWQCLKLEHHPQLSKLRRLHTLLFQKDCSREERKRTYFDLPSSCKLVASNQSVSASSYFGTLSHVYLMSRNPFAERLRRVWAIHTDVPIVGSSFQEDVFNLQVAGRYSTTAPLLGEPSLQQLLFARRRVFFSRFAKCEDVWDGRQVLLRETNKHVVGMFS